MQVNFFLGQFLILKVFSFEMRVGCTELSLKWIYFINPKHFLSEVIDAYYNIIENLRGIWTKKSWFSLKKKKEASKVKVLLFTFGVQQSRTTSRHVCKTSSTKQNNLSIQGKTNKPSFWQIFPRSIHKSYSHFSG